MNHIASAKDADRPGASASAARRSTIAVAVTVVARARNRPLRSTVRPCTTLSSAVTTYCQVSVYSPVTPAYRPVPPVIVPTMRRPVCSASPRSALKTRSPRASVHTARPAPTLPPSSNADRLAVKARRSRPDRFGQHHRARQLDDGGGAVALRSAACAATDGRPAALERAPGGWRFAAPAMLAATEASVNSDQ